MSVERLFAQCVVQSVFFPPNTGFICGNSWHNKRKPEVYYDSVVHIGQCVLELPVKLSCIVPSITMSSESKFTPQFMVTEAVITRWRSMLPGLAQVAVSWVENVSWMLAPKTIASLWCLYEECLLSRTACKMFASRSETSFHRKWDPTLSPMVGFLASRPHC